jgi:transcriptional regulator NrdR family protein
MTDSPGIPCPKCNQTTHQILNTRKSRGRVIRVRCCSSCNHTFRTGERVESNAQRRQARRSVTNDTSPSKAA